MKIKRTLKARLGYSLDGALSKLKNARGGALVFDYDLTVAMALREDTQLDKVACFRFAADANKPTECVAEVTEGEGTWVFFKLRILGTDTGPELDEYNAYLQKCADWLGEVGVREIELSPDVRLISDVLSNESCQALLRWEKECVRANPISGAADLEHWYDFIVTCYKHQEKLDASTLVQWLAEDQHWHENYAAAFRQVKESYAYSMGLLRFMEKK